MDHHAEANRRPATWARVAELWHPCARRWIWTCTSTWTAASNSVLMVLLSTRNATEWAIRRAEAHPHQMVCSEAPTRGWPITEGDGPPLPHPFAIVACVERFARRSAARRSEVRSSRIPGPRAATSSPTAWKHSMRTCARAHVRAAPPFAEVDIFAEPAANLFARVEALLPQAAALHAPAWTQLRSSNYFGAPPRPRKRPRPPPPPCLHGSFADGGAAGRGPPPSSVRARSYVKLL